MEMARAFFRHGSNGLIALGIVLGIAAWALGTLRMPPARTASCCTARLPRRRGYARCSIGCTITHDGTLVAALGCEICWSAYYEWVHYVAHVPFRPLTPVGRYMKKYHLWHHFKNERRWFGVTNPALVVH